MAKKSAIQPKTSTDLVTREYVQALSDIKQQIKEAQVKAVLAANKELIKLYWSIGAIIAERQKISDWGTKVIEQWAKDLKTGLRRKPHQKADAHEQIDVVKNRVF